MHLAWNPHSLHDLRGLTLKTPTFQTSCTTLCLNLLPPKSNFRSRCSPAFSCLRNFEYTPTWYSICLECSTPTHTMAGWLLPIPEVWIKGDFFLITPSLLLHPPSSLSLFLSPMFVLFPWLPSSGTCMCLSPSALPGSGEGPGVWWSVLSTAVSSGPRMVPNTQKSRHDDLQN